MVIKIYISEISGNFEVKKHQQRIETVLDSCDIRYDLVDVAAADQQEARLFMQETARARPGDPHPLPPQIYNEDQYCGDYEDFDYANETGQLLQFLKLREGAVTPRLQAAPCLETEPSPPPTPQPAPITQNGVTHAPDDAPDAIAPPLKQPEEMPPPPDADHVEEETHRPREETWQIDRSGGDCADADKEVRLSQFHWHERYSYSRSRTGGVQNLRYT